MRGWRRVGVVLSVLWFLGFGYYLMGYTCDNIKNAHTSALEACNIWADLESKAAWNQYPQAKAQIARRQQDCRDEESASWSRQLKAHPDSIWGIIAFDAASLAFFWLLAGIVVGVGRWVAAGFQKRTAYNL